MDIVVTGSHGLIGTALVARLERDGHKVTRLSRSGPGPTWDPDAGDLDPAVLMGVRGESRPKHEPAAQREAGGPPTTGAKRGVDAVVNLAGESIGEGRWSAERKRRILESRVKGTTLLAETMASMDDPPEVLVNASAIGFYGDRGGDELTEDSPAGGGFLADVVEQWEAATDAASAAGIRVVLVRSGIVLSGDGGALARMLTPFRFGAGGPLGGGNQWMSWITLEDEIAAFVHALTTDEVDGPMNAVSPNPVRNHQFARTLGKVLHRPSLVPTPGIALKLALGNQLAEELLMYSQRIVPEVLRRTGFQFAYPDLEPALRAVLDRPAAA